jgi:uncharacterized protein
MHLSAIYVYPIKSAAALGVDCGEVEARGLRGDRRWLVVDGDGRFLTGRQCPALVLIRARPTSEGLVLAAPGSPPLAVGEPQVEQPRLRATVWRDDIDAVDAGPEAAAWLTDYLGRPARLVFMDALSRRDIDPDYGAPGDQVSFADGYPALAIGQAALDALNARLPRPMSMLRFRPNLVIADAPAHAEDGWRRVRVGAVEFAAVKPCTRCVFTTVDPETGRGDADGEPLRTLKSYRRGDRGITFGMNLIPRTTGAIRIGDAVRVLA